MTNIAARPVPLLPPDLLKQHHCAVPTDTRYRAAARLAQTLWREAQGHSCGKAPDSRTGRDRRFGSLLGPAPARAGVNLVDPALVPLVRREVAYCEVGATIDPDRLWGNLLSSQTLAFSLFGPLKRDIDLATRVLSELFPDIVASVDDILFEHSPGRSDLAFTGDRTAFDVLVRSTTPDGSRGFVAIEVKYTEAPSNITLATNPRFDELSHAAAVFTDPASPALLSGTCSQFWRQQLLATAMLEHGLYDVGRVAVIAPLANHDCWRAIRSYTRLHASTDPAEAHFEALPLEKIVGEINDAGANDTARRLSERYLDFEPVHAALEKHWLT